MYFMLFILSALVIGTILSGFWLHRHPLGSEQAGRWLRPSILGGLGLFMLAQLVLLVTGLADVSAEATATAAKTQEFTLGHALVFFGIALPTVASTIAAAWAVGPIGAAALAAVTEKPEIFGRSLVYLGLAEGIAIYGLVLSILLLDKI